jgi:hypothetical protein
MNRYENFKHTYVQDIFDEQILDDAFQFYCDANGITNTSDLKDKYYKFSSPKSNKEDGIKNLKEIFVGNQDKKAGEKFRVVLCNQKVKETDFTEALKGRENIKKERQQTIERIKDISSQVEECDMLVMAELATPLSALYGFCMHSAKNRMAIITGLEFINIKKVAYNFVVTLLPVTVEGVDDVIPFIRLKNDYTHAEIQLITGVEGGLSIPTLEKYIYHLFRWRGIAFTTYYCFEFANINMRNIFFNLLDLMVVPIWNRDNPYYNALGEATARDLHCYYIQVNTSDFGETRIIEPVSSERSDLARVKGGTINHPIFNVSFLVSDLKIHSLRESQLLTYNLNKDPKHNPNGFKPLPPNWSFDFVYKRKNNKKLLE